ncbi:MAG TPA: hypothetical protein DCP92_18990 [Nitrospiraceae bacterium]|nr:hypothetical protein [Nitrospiraceae bacterium]
MPLPDLCYTCHDKSAFTKKDIHPPVEAGMCTSCHNPHASEHKRMLLDETNTLCMTCHTDSAFKNRRHAVIGHPLQAKDITRGGAKEKYKDFSCVSCHNPHSSDSMKLWRFGATVAFDLCEHCHEK